MWKPIHDPGPWRQYLKKKENKGLSLMEVKQKYLKEQLEFEDFRGIVSSTLSPSLASSAAPAVGSKPNPTPTSIYPPKLYVESERQYPAPSTTTVKYVTEYIKYEKAGDKAWNGKPVYFTSRNVVDTPNYDYDPNGVYGNYIRYNIEQNRWEVVGCSDTSEGDCIINIQSFGVPIPDPEALLGWVNLIGNWDVIASSTSGVSGCYTATWVGTGPDPKTLITTLINFNTYVEDPGTATHGTTYSYQENGQYVLPTGVFNANTSLGCGEEPQPCDSLFNEVILKIRGEDRTLTVELDISDEDELVNGRRYWDVFIPGKRDVPDKRYTIRWNGNNWEIAYEEGSDPEIVISTNTNHTGEIPYDCSAIAGDALMTWTGNAPYENGFTTEESGGIYGTISISECNSDGSFTSPKITTNIYLSDTLYNGKKQWMSDGGDINVRWNDSLGTSGAWQVIDDGVASVNADHDGSFPYGYIDRFDINVYDMGDGSYYRVDELEGIISV